MISRLAMLQCGFCKNGTFDAVIRQQLPPEAVELYIKAVEDNARIVAALPSIKHCLDNGAKVLFSIALVYIFISVYMQEKVQSLN